MELFLLNDCKSKESLESTRHVKNNDNSKKHTLGRQRNTRYYDRILTIKKKSYKFSKNNNFVFNCSS